MSKYLISFKSRLDSGKYHHRWIPLGDVDAESIVSALSSERTLELCNNTINVKPDSRIQAKLVRESADDPVRHQGEALRRNLVDKPGS